MGARLWRRSLKPRLKILYEAIRARGLKLFIHTCGDIAELFPDIIELGVEVVHPIQPEAMDVARLQREYGKDISMYGGIGTQSTLVYGTPGDVAAVARARLETFRDGGYILGPAGAISTDAKIENVIALVDFAMSL
jgi:uroporphyrinogen decarboxylase